MSVACRCSGFSSAVRPTRRRSCPRRAQFTYFQGGGSIAACFLSAGRCSGQCQRLAARGKPHVSAGAGGFIDITAAARNLVFSGAFAPGARISCSTNGELTIRDDGVSAKFVPEVEHVTFSGRMARERGQNVTFITERCVIRLLPGRSYRDRNCAGCRSRAGCAWSGGDPAPRQPGTATDGRAAVPARMHGTDAAGE